MKKLIERTLHLYLRTFSLLLLRFKLFLLSFFFFSCIYLSYLKRLEIIYEIFKKYNFLILDTQINYVHVVFLPCQSS